MYVRTSTSNAELSPARALATRAPSRSAAASRSGESVRSTGTFALTESVTLWRALGSVHRRAACAISDLSPPALTATIVRLRFELALRRLGGALACVLLQLGRALPLLRGQQRHRLRVGSRDVRRDRVDDRLLDLAEHHELVAL